MVYRKECVLLLIKKFKRRGTKPKSRGEETIGEEG